MLILSQYWDCCLTSMWFPCCLWQQLLLLTPPSI
jgi:hypothetical protein